jgi:hypothetical protein
MMRSFITMLPVFLATCASASYAAKRAPAKHHDAKGQAIEARDSKRDVNLRESCRKAASGIYLSVWDQMNQTDLLLKGTESKKKAIETSLAMEKKTLATMQSKVAASNYDLKLAEAIDTKSGLVRTLENQDTEMKSVLVKAKENAASAKKAEQASRDEVSAVFDIIRVEKKPAKAGSRPLRLEFKSSCPKYRYLCPLPRDHAIRLREFADSASRNNQVSPETLEPCARYAEQSIQNRE